MKPEHEAIFEEAEDLVLDLAETKTADKLAIAKAVAKFLDAVVPLDVVLPGPAGLLAEQVDEIAFQAVVLKLMQVFHADPAKKAERIQRRRKRREERKERRTQKKADSHGK